MEINHKEIENKLKGRIEALETVPNANRSDAENHPTAEIRIKCRDCGIAFNDKSSKKLQMQIM